MAAFSMIFQPDAPYEVVTNLMESGILILDEYAKRLLTDLETHKDDIDRLIESHLKGWTMSRIPRTSVAALRIALAEMLYSEEQMVAVAINEAVELTKKYGSDGDYQFVNGVLGTVARTGATGENKC